MDARGAFGRVSASLDEYLQSLRMIEEVGPCRAMRELIEGMVWGGSVQLSNAARLRVQRRWIIRLREDRGLIGPDGTRLCFNIFPPPRFPCWANCR